MPPDSQPSRQLVTKKVIAARYGVSIRTINSWMRRRIIPYIKPSQKMVRFDPEICDIVIKSYEFKSIFDQTIKEEVARKLAENGRKPFLFQAELGVPPVQPAGG